MLCSPDVEELSLLLVRNKGSDTLTEVSYVYWHKGEKVGHLLLSHNSLHSLPTPPKSESARDSGASNVIQHVLPETTVQGWEDEKP